MTTLSSGWGSGGASDRAFRQCSMAPGADGFINPDNMRQLNHLHRPEVWDELGFRKTLDWENQVKSYKSGCCKSINLRSSANGTGTYRGELWRGGQLKHSFMIGVYPHPARNRCAMSKTALSSTPSSCATLPSVHRRRFT